MRGARWTLLVILIVTLLIPLLVSAGSSSSVSKYLISYSSNLWGTYDIWLIEADGSNPRCIAQLPGDEGWPSWSPDGSQVVFVRQVRGDPEHLWIMDADGSNLRQLTHGPGEETEPGWSPDGKKIVFTRIKEDTDGNGEFESWEDDSEIWVLDLETREEKQLTFNSSILYDKAWPYAIDWSPTWSPDGNEIAFTSARTGDSDIWIMRADGTHLRRLRLPEKGLWAWGPSWSVNGEIAFVDGSKKDQGIWIVNADGSNLHSCVLLQGYAWNPSWSPDGESLAFIYKSSWESKFDIWLVDKICDIRRAGLTDTPYAEEWTHPGGWVSIGNSPPVARFTYSPFPRPTDLDVIQFTDQSSDSDGRIVSWHWDFGDGSTSSERNPTHRYRDDGTYTVKLTVIDDDGATDTTSKRITVSNAPPEARFIFSPLRPIINMPVSFDATPSEDLDGSVVQYEWDFSDGSTGEGKVTTHTFTKEGAYKVKLTVTDDDGTSASVEQEVKVLEPGGGGGPA